MSQSNEKKDTNFTRLNKNRFVLFDILLKVLCLVHFEIIFWIYRPQEISSKKPVPFYRNVFQAKKREIIDPRFSSAFGEYKPDVFRKSYGFVNDMRQREKEVKLIGIFWIFFLLISTVLNSNLIDVNATA